jgi:hypothetical protein
MDTRTIIDYAMNDDAKAMRDALYASIHDRVNAHIRAQKQEVAQNIFPEEVEEESEEIDEASGNNEKRHLDSIIKMKEVKKSKHDMAPSIHDHMEDALEKGNHKKIDQLHKVFKHVSESVEELIEGKMDKMTLSGLWHKHAQHQFGAENGYGGGEGGQHSNHAATAIENHVRKHYGNKVADDMLDHSDHHVARVEYAGRDEYEHHEKEGAKLRAKHKISGDLLGPDRN